MCLYHTYHWSCCRGTAQPAPYYMNSKCDVASAPTNSRLRKQRKCKIEHKILDGADHDRPCPKCGQLATEIVEDTTITPAQSHEAVDSQDEQLAWTVEKLTQQQETLTAMDISRKKQ